jgi:membrane-associated protein
MVDLLRHLIEKLHQLKPLIGQGGTPLVSLIVFIETGIFVGVFLPGDSLLVTAGLLAAAGPLKLAELLVFVPLCAIAGDQLGYLIGRKAGAGLYQREDSRFFKKGYLTQAHEFYEKYGKKTIIMARFLPVIRTFCPAVAGAARMNYGRYLTYDIIGGVLWVWSMVLVGYTLGRTFPNVDRYIDYVIGAIIVVSLLPAAYQAWKARRQ